MGLEGIKVSFFVQIINHKSEKRIKSYFFVQIIYHMSEKRRWVEIFTDTHIHKPTPTHSSTTHTHKHKHTLNWCKIQIYRLLYSNLRLKGSEPRPIVLDLFNCIKTQTKEQTFYLSYHWRSGMNIPTTFVLDVLNWVHRRE